MRSTSSRSAAKFSRCSSALRRSSTVRLRALGGLSAAKRSSNRLACGSSGMRSGVGLTATARPGRSERERLTHPTRPAFGLDTVDAEQRHSEAVHTEGYAAGVRRGALLVFDFPSLPKQIAVVIETHARGRRSAREVGNQQLELQRLLQLADRHHLTHAPKERVTGDLKSVGQRQLCRQTLRALHPVLTERRNLFRRADAHEFAHTEGLQAVELA